MMLLPDHRAVFVSVPKCATRTMYTAVLGPHYNGRRYGGHHETMVPGHARDWFAWAIVRNPYDRAVSLWWSTTQRGDDRYGFRRRVDDPDNLESFMRYIVEQRPKVASLGPNQSEHLRGVRLDRVLRLETLDEGFRGLPFYRGSPDPLPVVNDTQRGQCREYVTPAVAALVGEWALEDFAQFGYPIMETTVGR